MGHNLLERSDVNAAQHARTEPKQEEREKGRGERGMMLSSAPGLINLFARLPTNPPIQPKPHR